MRASDRIKYFSIVSKINKGQFDDIAPDEYVWLQSNPHVLKDMNLTRKKKNYFKSLWVVMALLKRSCFL